MKKFFTTIGITIIVLTAIASNAYAVSLPYVDDVNYWTDKTNIATITCVGNENKFKLRVIDTKTHKRLKIQKHKKNVWTVVLKNKHTYKIKVRGLAKNHKTAWKTIYYRIS